MESAEQELWTTSRVLTWTQKHFAARGLQSPRLDAELLLAHALGRTRVGLYTHFDAPLHKDELARFRDLIKRRLEGIPVAYLISQKEFFGLPLYVSEAVLIPRPDTELLVEVALRLLAPKAAAAASSEEPALAVEVAEPGVELHIRYDPPPEAPSDEELAPAAPKTAAEPAALALSAQSGTVVDVGTGSGAVALTIAQKRRDCRVLAIDASLAALEVAQKNAQRLNLAVEFFCGDLLTPLKPAADIELVVANLPYIATAEIDTLAKEVRSEPRSALDGGADGLTLIRRLIAQAPNYLRPGGALALEVGAGQAEATAALLAAARFVNIQIADDLAHIPRVVYGRRADS